MTHQFQKVLELAAALGPKEQVALIAMLSEQLYQHPWGENQAAVELSKEDIETILARVADLEAGVKATLGGDVFRAKLRKKYGH